MFTPGNEQRAPKARSACACLLPSCMPRRELSDELSQALGPWGGGGLHVEHQQGLSAVKRLRSGCRIVSVGCTAAPAKRMTSRCQTFLCKFLGAEVSLKCQ